MKEPSINVMSVLLLVGAAQGIFLSLVLAGIKKKNRIANLFLASLLLLFSIGLMEAFLSVTYFYVKVPFLIGVQWPLIFLYGPLAYFYVKSLTEPELRIKYWKLSVHFLPAVLMYIYLMPLYVLNSEAKAKIWLFENGPIGNSMPVIDPIQIIVIIQITGYLALCLRLLKKHSRNIREKFSSIENINLSWLKTLIIIFFFLLCAYTFFSLFSRFYGVYKQSEYLLNLLIAVIIYVMGYKGIRQPEIFSPPQILPARHDSVSSNDAPDTETIGTGSSHDGQQDSVGRKQEPAGFSPVPTDTSRAVSDLGQPEAENQTSEKYKKSSLTDEQSANILGRLTELMEKEKPYLEMGLTLPMLSNILDVSPNHLSQVINGKLNKSFFDFVNEYRVEEAKKALVSPGSDRFSILGIAMDAGFNSKSSFYTAFKKHTGMTPSEFKARQ